MRRFNLLKKYDVVSKFDNVDIFGRSRRFRRTPSPQATEPALLCNFDGNEVSEVPEPFDQTRHSSASIKNRIEAEEEKTTNKFDVSRYTRTINIADIELSSENPEKNKHKDKKHKLQKKDRSERKRHKKKKFRSKRKRHKKKKQREKREKEAHAIKDSLVKRLEDVNVKDDIHSFLLTETGTPFMHDNIDDLSKARSHDIDINMHKFLGSDDEEYDRRFADVKRYIPFLETMIERHRQMSDLKSLKKMECLYEVLTHSKKKLKMETLRRCEDVLEKLYHKVGEVVREESNIHAPNDDNLSTVLPSHRNTRFHQTGNLDTSFEEGCMSPMSSPSSSPTPSYSPKDSLQPVDDDIDSDAIIKHLESEAESLEDDEIFNASWNSDDDTDDASVQSISRVEIPTFSKRDSDMSIDEECDTLEEKPQSPDQDKHTWKPIIVTGHDVVTAAKPDGNNISKGADPALRSYTPPPKPVENTQLEEAFVNDDSYDSFNAVFVDDDSYDSFNAVFVDDDSCDSVNADLNDTIPRSDSPLNVPETGLQSPDPELFSEERSNSPKKREEPPQPVPPPEIQPIAALPRVNDIPLISMADLEDLIKNQSKILKDQVQQHQQTKDEKDAEKAKEIAKAQELEAVTPIRRKQTGNVKIAPMTLKLDAFITGGKDQSPSLKAPVDPRIRARMLKEQNVDPRQAKEKAAVPPRCPPPEDLYSLHDFNINPVTLSSPNHTTPVTHINDYPPTGSSNQWNHGSSIPMPDTPNPYGMPRDSNMHADSWNMNQNMNFNMYPNLGPNININRNTYMNLNRNPNMAQNSGYGNNIMPLVRPAVPYPSYDTQMNYSQHPQRPQHLQHQQYPHGRPPLDNFYTKSMPYRPQQPPYWNRPGDAIRDLRAMNNLRAIHRPEWNQGKQSDWDRDGQFDWNRERQMDREMPLDRERHNNWDNRNRFNKDPRIHLEPSVYSANLVKVVTKDTSTTIDQKITKEQTTSKDSTTTNDSTIGKDAPIAKDSTTARDSAINKDFTTRKDSPTKKEPRLSAKEKPKAVEKEKESKKSDMKDSNKSSKSSSKSDSRKPKVNENNRNKEKSRKSESRRRQESEKGKKPQSSLKSLHGVETKAAAGQQVFHKLKIPKLKKPEAVSSLKPTTLSNTKSTRHADSKGSSKNDDSKSRNRMDESSHSKNSSRKDREKDKGRDKDKKMSKKQEEVLEPAKTNNQEEKVAESERSGPKNVKGFKSFKNKLFTEEGGKKLFMNPVEYDKFQEVIQKKNISEFRQLVQSDSDCSDSGKKERVTKKRKLVMKKRRVIESDSSEAEEESISRRIGKLESPANEKKKVEELKMSRKLRKRPSAAKEPEEDPNKKLKIEVVKENTAKEDVKGIARKDEQLKDPKERIELIKEGEAKESNESLITEPMTPKARAKPRRKSYVERLQEDLKDYISPGTIITGHRTCRLARESQAATITTISPNTSNIANESITELTEINELIKNKTKNKAGSKCAKKTVSKDFVSNSETEENQHLAIRKEPVKKKKMLGPKSKRQASDLALEPQILLQRVDTLTLDEPAKAIESSSDESFSVNASEMTVSLDSPIADNLKAEITNRSRTISGAAERKRGKPSNKEDEAQVTDDESLSSDISLSSSVIAKKADGMAKAFQDVLEKDGEAAKATEDDFQPTDKIGEKPPAKKMKKKSAWRLGIVSEAKRRKKQPQPQEKQAATLQSEGADIRRLSTEVIDDHEVRKEIHGTDNTPRAKAKPDQTEEQKRNNCQTIKETEIVVKPKIKLKDLEHIVKRDDSVLEVDSRNDSDLMIVDENMKDEELKINVNNNQLIDYVCYSQEETKCLRCTFSGKSIVYHYKAFHPGKEVSVSRLKALEAKSAIQESNDNDFKNTCLLPTEKQDYHFSCRFCSYKMKGRKEEAMESAYEHITSHTGEYRFRCIECNYQSIARSAIKMHYYKNCKKLGKAIQEAVVEQKVPQENRLYGYMCSFCNFVQLRLNNVKDHIKMWHDREPSPKVVKINMSLDAPGDNAVEVSETLKEPIVISLLDDEESISIGKRNARSIRRNRVEEEEPQVTLPNDLHAEIEKEKGEKEARKSNLSAFVCPPELEKMNEEIELERKKKMQEIVENMSMNFKKNVTKKGLSIIDKLKDRMDTIVECQTAENDFRGDLGSPESDMRIVESLNEETENLVCSEAVANVISDFQKVLDTNESDKSSKLKDPLDVKNEPLEDEESDSEDLSLRYECESSSENEIEDVTDVSVFLRETSNIKNQSNDSMMTTIQRLAAQIQSSKPLEAAGAEVVADGGATSDRNSAKKEIQKAPDVPLTTSFKRKSLSGPQNIQVVHEDQSQEPRVEGASSPKLFLRPRRLSGDMLSVPEPSSETPEPYSSVADPSTGDPEIEATSEKSPSTSNISTTERGSFLKSLNSESLATINETESPMMSDNRKAVETSQVKLSGLSVLKKNVPLILNRVKNPPTYTLSNQTITAVNPSSHQTVKLIPINVTPTSSVQNNSQSNYLPIMSSATFKNYMDAKKVAIPTPSIPNAITTEPAILTPVSVSKPITKSGILTPITLAPNTSGFSINNALPKKACTITVTKPRTVALGNLTTAVTDTTSLSRKLMTLVVYNEMMKPERLRELYKCMGRECPYTTDSVEHFKRHFEEHSASSNANSSSLVSFDFRKCAYCSITVTDWHQMKKHYEEKHAYCEFQCSYCFYRAVTQAYVEIHQAIIHPEKQVAVLQCSVSNNLRPHTEINRSKHVKPFYCQHECNNYFFVAKNFVDHLRRKHATIQVYKCHLCKVASYTPDQLIVHYKNHGILKYQCLYCDHGTESMTEMHAHLSSNHCEQNPVLLERTLPPQPTKTRSAIDQLLLRNAEEHYTLLSKVIRTNGKIQLDQHINAKHSNDPEVDYQTVYKRIKGTKKLMDPMEQGTPVEPLDTTPLWHRDMSRVKNIRGVCIEEEPTKKDSSATPTTQKFVKRKSDTDISAKSGKVRCIKPLETDDNDPERGQYGYYGSPSGVSYECTICNQFKTTYEHDMRDHLYGELKYVRFHCKTCDFASVNKNSLASHCSKNHEGEVPDCESLSPNSSIEEWVMTLLKRQAETIKKNLEKLNSDAGGPGSSKSASTLKQSMPRSPGKSLLNTSGPVDLDLEDDNDKNNEDASDVDVSKIIEEVSSSDQPKKLVLICKHCKQTFNSKRGFKVHVKKQHLKQYKFLCPLCDRSANLEFHIQQHIKSKHPGCSMEPIPNEANVTELNDEFWLKEYEVSSGKEKRGQKRKVNFEEIAAKKVNANVIDDTFTCLKCNFVSANLADHTSHQKTHKLLFKCAYCSYTGMVKNEVKKHSQSDHPHLTPNVEEIPITGNAQVASPRLFNGQISSIKTGAEPSMGASSEKKFNYWCIKCRVRCKTYFSMKKHLARAHKAAKPNKGAKRKTGPFNYTNIFESPTTLRELVSTSPNAQRNDSEDLSDPSAAKCSYGLCDLPLKCKAADPLQIPKDYRCPECSLETNTYKLMYKHIKKHIRMFKCKYCERYFCEPNQVTLHNEKVHPGLEPKIESVKNCEEQLSDMLNRITGGLGLESESSEHQSVAKKSTARPIARVRSFPKKLKTIARKSTNPLPRYPLGLKFSNEHANVRGISHYGVPWTPIDLGSINTYMVVGGHRVPVDCLTLSQLMNIDPKVIVVDIKKGLNMSR